MLTDDMTRLVGEIGAMRGAREGFVSDLKDTVSELKDTVSEMQAGFRDAHGEMGERTRADLQAFASRLKDTVSEMQAGFGDAHGEMSEKTRADLEAFVSGLKDTVSEMQAGFRDAHGEMSEKTRADLEAFVSGLKDYVSRLKDTVAGVMQDSAADIAGAHEAWHGRLPAEAARAEREQVEREEAETEPQFSQETPEEGIPDDLTAIRGIGSALQSRLNDAGFHTYAQLAESTPDDLRRALALGNGPARANVEDWISQAWDLA